MQSQALLLFLVAGATVFVLTAITVLIAKLRSRAFIRLIKVLARETEPAIRVKISQGGNK